MPFGNFAKKGDYFESDHARESKPKLAIGATYNYNVGAQRSRGQLGSWLDESRNLKTLYVDAMYKHNGFSAMGEYVNRQAEGSAVVSENLDGSVDQSFYTGKAVNTQLAYLFENNFEIDGNLTVTGETTLSNVTVNGEAQFDSNVNIDAKTNSSPTKQIFFFILNYSLSLLLNYSSLK